MEPVREVIAGKQLCVNDSVEACSTVKATVFGELVKLAYPFIEHFHSDLYHDARWIDKNLAGPMTFYFGADDNGTAIGSDQHLVTLERKNGWTIVVEHNDRGHWLFTAVGKQDNQQ